MAKALTALSYAVLNNVSEFRDEAMQLDFANGAKATIRHSGLNQIVIAFVGGNLNALPLSAFNEMETVTFLEDWVSTAEAPTVLLDVVDELIEMGPVNRTFNGTLTDAIEELMGDEEVLHIILTGQAAGGGLAVVTAAALGRAFPLANVDVQAFGMPWIGFSPAFSWAFDQLATLYYIWPFNSTHVLHAIQNQTSNSSEPYQRAAVALDSIITFEVVSNATLLPNLPPSYPPDYQAGARAPLGSITPVDTNDLIPSACPPIVCKSRVPAQAACFLWRPQNETVFPDQPKDYLSSNLAADAVVSWDSDTQTAYIVWEGTDTREDWATDLLLVQSSDFRPTGLEMFEGVEVHRGFLNQFNSLTDGAESPETNITAIILGMSGGITPRRVVTSGHSLGSALASLTGVWASALWPNASVTVVGTGTPKVGNEEWVREFRAVVGRAYRFVYEIDQVPSLPPLDSYHQLPDGVWFRANYTIAINRPPFGLDDTTWDDHDCENLYVPAIMNATKIEAPGYITTNSVESASLPSYVDASPP